MSKQVKFQRYDWTPFPMNGIDNMYRKDCPGDGDCQFHTIANLLNLKQVFDNKDKNKIRITQQELRKLVADYVEENKNNREEILGLFSDFLPGEETLRYSAQVNRLIENIKIGGLEHQGTHTTLAVLAKKFNYIFLVFQNDDIIPVYPINQDNCDNCAVAMLYYVSLGDSGHYQLLGLQFKNKKGQDYIQTTFNTGNIWKLMQHDVLKEALEHKKQDGDKLEKVDDIIEEVEENKVQEIPEVILPKKLIVEEPKIVEAVKQRDQTNPPLFTSEFVDNMSTKLNHIDGDLMKNINAIVKYRTMVDKYMNQIDEIDRKIRVLNDNKNMSREENNQTLDMIIKLKSEKEVIESRVRDIMKKVKEMSRQVGNQRSQIEGFLLMSNKARQAQVGGAYGIPIELINRATRKQLNDLALTWNINYSRFKKKQDLQKALRYVIYFKTHEIDDYKSYKVIASIYNLPHVRSKKRLKDVLNQITMRVSVKSIFKIMSS